MATAVLTMLESHYPGIQNVDTSAVELMLYLCSVTIIHCLLALCSPIIPAVCKARKIKLPPCMPYCHLPVPYPFAIQPFMRQAQGARWRQQKAGS
jgi:hypothetical protein